LGVDGFGEDAGQRWFFVGEDGAEVDEEAAGVEAEENGGFGEAAAAFDGVRRGAGDANETGGKGLGGGGASAGERFAWSEFEGGPRGEMRGEGFSEAGRAKAERLIGSGEEGEGGDFVVALEQICAEGSGEGFENEFVEAESAIKRVAAEARDEDGLAGEDARLRSAEQFVSTEAD
jgi:hypothetical protein